MKSDMSPMAKSTSSEKSVNLKSCLSPRVSPRASDDSVLVSSLKSESDSPTRTKKPLAKVVSFSELSQFFAPSHTVEEVWGIRADSCVVDMIPEDEEIDRKGITRVDFTSIDKTSVAAEVVPANQGEKAFSMDLVFQKLLDLQLSQDNGGDLPDGCDNETMKEKESSPMKVSNSDHISINMAVQLALEANSATNSKNNSGNNTVTNSNNNSTKNLDALFDSYGSSSRESLESPMSPNVLEISTTTTTIATNDNLPSSSITPQLSSWNSKYGAKKTTNNSVSVVPNLLLHEALNKPPLPVETIPSIPTTTTPVPTVPSVTVNELPGKKKKSVRMHFVDEDDVSGEVRDPIIQQPTDPIPVSSSSSSSSAAAVSPASSSSSSSSSSRNNIKSSSFQVSDNHNDHSNDGKENKGLRPRPDTTTYTPFHTPSFRIIHPSDPSTLSISHT